MKTFSTLIILNLITAWHIKLTVSHGKENDVDHMFYNMQVQSDAGGRTAKSCVSSSAPYGCRDDNESESNQGGYLMNNLQCSGICCSATIFIRDGQKDYEINTCASCPNGSEPALNKNCIGTKGYSFYNDGSIETIGGDGNPTRKYKVLGDHKHSRKHSREHKHRGSHY